MINRDIVTIGTSAGGVEALRFLAGKFPRDFPATVLVTIHLASDFRSELDEILSKCGPLPVSFAREGEPMQKGHVYIAPTQHHLIIDGESLFLGVGPRENNSRPAIDAMFRSAAACCGGRVIGVVLTGTLGDGASGLWTIRQCGGITVVQDPSDAAFPDMPRTAMILVQPDHVARLADIPTLLARLAREPDGTPKTVPETLKYEVEVARSGRGNMKDMDRFGRRSVLSCPDCGGIMWEIEEGRLLRYRCHTGHAYAADVNVRAGDLSLRARRVRRHGAKDLQAGQHLRAQPRSAGLGATGVRSRSGARSLLRPSHR
jgi:two-component system chemotaxis response regulator CheB